MNKITSLMIRLLSVITIIFLFSCGSDGEKKEKKIENTDSLTEFIQEDSLDKIIVSDYDMSGVDKKMKREFKENLLKIEKEHGVQWDFCDCVVKGDSINKAFMKDKISDNDFTRLEKRLNEIDQHCQAFRIQDPNTTPEERAEHENKVRKCLKEAGIK